MSGISAGIGYHCLHVLLKPAAALGHATMLLGGRHLIPWIMVSAAASGVQALGISVEFCAHVLHAFVVAPGTRRERMAAAVTDVGASVLSGITLTKFVGEPCSSALAPVGTCHAQLGLYHCLLLCMPCACCSLLSDSRHDPKPFIGPSLRDVV